METATGTTWESMAGRRFVDIETGDHAGEIFALDSDAPDGAHVMVKFHPDDQFARVVEVLS